MIKTVLVFLAAGALGYTPVMDTVAQNRYTGAISTRRTITVDPEQFDCVVGVHNELAWLVGQEVYFYPEGGGRFGPWLVVDYARKDNDMKKNGLLADISCERFNHDHGFLVQIRTVH